MIMSIAMNDLGIVRRNIPRADGAAVEKLSHYGVATIHEAMGRVGLMQSYMRPIYAGARLCGTAVTVLLQPGDNWMMHVAAEVLQPGDVVVAACTVENTDGFFGDLLATSYRARGAKGLIIDGGVRDVMDLTEMKFPVFSRAISARVQPLLDVGSPVTPEDDATCAVFYSITNCQEGLRGISFGNFLIKQVAVELRDELPRIRRFATLSPVPGFRGWMRANRDKLVAGVRSAALRALFERLESPDWFAGDGLDEVEALLMPLAAYYLTQARRGRELFDSVARFHLGNGARLERINWQGDLSPKGLAEEAPLAYKDVDRVVRVVERAGLARRVARLVPLGVVKG